jgi:deoxyribonuclease V
MKFGFDKLRNMQEEIAKQFTGEDTIKIKDVKKVAGFDISYDGEKAICAGIILDINTMNIIETKQTISKTPMNYVPGFLCFREGPIILQTYYDFENEPDILIISGHGITHPKKCGLATYIGVELAKPTIGIAKNLLHGEIQKEKIIFENQIIGKAIKTKDHANPVYLSQGNMISLETAEKIIKKLIVFPHKLPEPIHIAHKISSKIMKEQKAKKNK